MRKLTTLLISCLLIAYLALGVSAATGATAQESFATVSGDGSCQITTTVTLHLEEPQEKLLYPIPLEATGVTLNGSRVTASRSGDVRVLNLSRLTKNVVGDVTVNIHYRLYDVIETTDSGLQMKLPLMSGFAFPVEELRFSVTLPGAVEALPSLVSGYHQARIEEDLTYSVEGATVSGSSLKPMKDHETLYMTLPVSQQMFPQSITQSQDYGWGTAGMGVCAMLSLVWWVIALWNMPVRRQHCTQPPQTYHPGQAGSILAGQGLDLSMTVLHWAQLGYISIASQRGKVVLYKRMEMGNERTDSELRIFKKLFGGRTAVDTGSDRYAQLYRDCATQRIGVRELFRKWSGNAKVFRFLASGIGLFGGASLAVAMADGAALQGVLLAVLSIAGLLSGWYIQGIGVGLLLGDSRRLKLSLGICLGWLVLGMLSADVGTAFWMVAGLLLAGILLSWGGRRTRQGRVLLAQMMGLRHHLGSSAQKLMQQSQPEYFFSMLPWAMALGCGSRFARACGKTRPEGCDYLAVGADKLWTGEQWYKHFSRIVRDMNRRAHQIPMERFLGLMQSMTRR